MESNSISKLNNIFSNFFNQCSTELGQSQEKSYNLLFYILSSKRLLTEHVEVLEDCLQRFGDHSDYFSLKGLSVSLLSSTVLFLSTRNSLKYILPTIGTGYALLSTVKVFNYTCNKIDENRLKSLVESIDRFDSCCRRILLFLNDSQHFRAIPQQMNGGSEKEMVQNVIQSILDVIKYIWNGIKTMERDSEMPSDFFYEPMEDLEDCEFLKKTDFDNKDVKITYNIFTYIQSHFLMRLALTTTHLPQNKFLKTEIKNLKNLLETNSEKCSKEFDQKTSFLKIKTKTNEFQRGTPSSQPAEILKTLSFNFTSKICAVANECKNLDEILQKIKIENNKKELHEIVQNFQTVEDALQGCQDEFQRIFISYHKLLQDLEIPIKIESVKVVPEQNDKDLNESQINEPEELKDDFFALDGTEDIESSSKIDDILNIDTRITKTYFKPVLLQLKEKIDPISKSMKEKERKVLKSKGFETDLDEEVRNINYGSNEDDSSDDEMPKRRQTKKYDDVRSFLESKEQFSLWGGGGLPLGLPNKSFTEEDILE